MSEEQLAALDSDWQRYSAAERAAFELARRLTYAPHTLTDASLERLRQHYNDKQILEIIFTVANNNATTRWTEALGIPQEDDGSFFGRSKDKNPEVLRTFLTPTPDAFKEQCSSTLPDSDAWKRPTLGSRDEAEHALAACRKRTSRIPLVEEAAARALLPAGWPKGPLPQWVLLLANFPKAGSARAESLRRAEKKGGLNRRLKAQIAWIAARHDRAWYALGQAKRRLRSLGLSDDDIYRLDGPWDSFTAAEQAAFRLVRKLTVHPSSVTDEDIAELRKLYEDRQVAELIYHVCNAALFDRLTEACGLRLEEN